MRKRWILSLTLLSLLAVSRPVGAQTGAPPGGNRDAGEARTKLYEDVEILRRLMSQKLEGLYGARWSVPTHENSNLLIDMGHTPNVSSAANQWLSRTNVFTKPTSKLFRYDQGNRLNGRSLHYVLSTAWPEIEGTYLKGHGVVYHMTLPPPAAPPKQEGEKPAPKPVSDWERVRKQVRGEKEQPTPAAPEAKPPSLSENILKVLYENGHHLPLAADESVTVAVTFREQPRATANAAIDWAAPVLTNVASFVDYDADGMGDLILMVGQPNTAENPNAAPNDNKPANDPQFANATSPHDHVLLGDLCLKQDKVNDAVTAYESALRLLAKGAPTNGTASKAEVYKKLLQALAAKGDMPALRKATEEYEAAVQEHKAAAAGQKAEKTPKPEPLPGKMIITVSKKLLEQTRATNGSFEDFRKAASVEYLSFAK